MLGEPVPRLRCRCSKIVVLQFLSAERNVFVPFKKSEKNQISLLNSKSSTAVLLRYTLVRSVTTSKIFDLFVSFWLYKGFFHSSRLNEWNDLSGHYNVCDLVHMRVWLVAYLWALIEFRKYHQISKIPKPKCVSGHSEQL